MDIDQLSPAKSELMQVLYSRSWLMPLAYDALPVDRRLTYRRDCFRWVSKITDESIVELLTQEVRARLQDRDSDRLPHPDELRRLARAAMAVCPYLRQIGIDVDPCVEPDLRPRRRRRVRLDD